MKNYLLCFLLSFALCLFLCAVLIPCLKKLKAGQNILSYVKEHQSKSGTPTMGGIAFVLSSCIVTLLLGERTRQIFVTLAIGAAFMAVGMIDDALKLRHKENEGLKPYQKILFQLGVSVVAGVYCCYNGYTAVNIPFTSLSFDIGYLMLPVCVFVFIASVNSVNLTDGLDGLAASSCMAFFFVVGVLILLQKQFVAQSTVCFCLTGSLSAYLVFNVSKASVFMGDTGSLSLGGFLSCVCVFTGNALYIPVIGFVFVLSSITVIVQVIYYKKNKKRIFLMAPIHHHFQEKGYSESKISYVYSLVTLLLGALCILAVL